MFRKLTGNCERCHEETNSITGSWFNTQMICPTCNKIEAKHEKYEEAKRIETEHLIDGDRNFEGIGLPNDFEEFAIREREKLYNEDV